MMNIGVVVDNELNDDKRVLREISILREEGFKIHALCFAFDDKQYDEIEGVDVTRIPISRKLKNTLFFFQNTIPLYEWFWRSEIKKFILLNSIDIIHAHDLYMSKAAYTGIKKSGKDIPFILDLHENYPFAVQTYNWTKGPVRNLISKPGKWSRVEKEYLGYPDKVIVLSPEFGEELVSRYDFITPSKICSFPNVPDLKQTANFITDRSRLKFEKKGPVIFYFGVVAERRGIFEALEAFSEITRERTGPQFLIIGPIDKKDKERFYSYLNEPRLSEQIIYIPWISLDELDLYLDQSDICLAPFLKNPQHESGVANKIYDYMLGRKAIVASDCKPQKNLIEQYSCGLVYSNREELKQCITALLENAEQRQIMGENGYKAVISHFNTGTVRGELIKCYREALKK